MSKPDDFVAQTQLWHSGKGTPVNMRRRHVGIVGHEAAKFTAAGRALARRIIETTLAPGDVVVSGGCHLGGVDIWAEEIAGLMGLPTIVHKPERLAWSDGFKERNLLIARDSDEIHVIVVKWLSDTYTGMRFTSCYHCQTNLHIKSGACWTAKQAQRMGKRAVWHEVENG